MTHFTPGEPYRPQRVAANEETTILTPVADGTDALDRLPVSVRRRWIVVSAILAALLVAAIAFIAYLWNVTSKWEVQVADVKAQNYDLGDTVADREATIEDLTAQLETTSNQLASAQQRVLELADEAAQRGDTTEYYATALADLGDLLAASQSVSATLVRCVEGHQDLVGYLKQPDKYDAADVATFESQVNSMCSNAVSANDELQQLIAEQQG